MTLYEELDLSPDCTPEEIKQQYRTLAMKHHPDLGGDVERFKRIKFAYEILSNPNRRKQYDENQTTTELNLGNEVITTLANVFFGIIPTFNCLEDNLVNRMKQEIDNMKSGALQDLDQCEIFIKNLEVVKSKLKLKNNNDENILLGFLEKQLENRYRDKVLFNHRIKIADDMLIVLDKYSYGFLELVNDQPVESSSEVPN